MSFPARHLALMSELPRAADAGAPDWIHLLPAPADGLVRTGDTRGPYTLAPFAEIIAATFRDRDAIEIDVNHATYLAASRGERSDAMGWIRELQAREDGLWGKVDWTEEGARLVAGRAYRGISPVVLHDAAKKITGLANASLVNRANLRGLTALHSEETQMGIMQRLIELLKLEEGATEEQVMAALEKAMKPAESKPDAETAAMQAQMTAIGTALGVTGGDGAAILEAAKAKGASDPTEVAALQAELATLATRFNEATAAGAREKAEGYVDAEINRGRVGLKPVRDRYIAMHMADAPNAVALIEAMPMLSAGRITPPAVPGKEGEIALQSEELKVAAMLGIDPKAFEAERKAENARKETAQ